MKPDLNSLMTYVNLHSSGIGYHNRHELILPGQNSRLQRRLNNLEEYVYQHEMKINASKTKVQLFNFSRSLDFILELTIEQRQLDVVPTTKLLGVTISSDCKWNHLVEDLVTKANQKMWFLLRLKVLGASITTLVTIYKLFIGQGLEIAAQVWSSALNQGHINQFEQVQSMATAIILGPAPPPRFKKGEKQA